MCNAVKHGQPEWESRQRGDRLWGPSRTEGLYKPPMRKRTGGPQWRVVRGAVAVRFDLGS